MRNTYREKSVAFFKPLPKNLPNCLVWNSLFIKDRFVTINNDSNNFIYIALNQNIINTRINCLSLNICASTFLSATVFLIGNYVLIIHTMFKDLSTQLM